MKKHIALALALALIHSASADTKVIDGQRFITSENQYGQLCMAALESKAALRKKAEELKVSRRDMKKVTCNGLSLVRFARTHKGDMKTWFAKN